MQKEIDLKDHQLGSKLLEDPKGDFPLDVWEAYCSKPFAHLGFYPLRVLSWRTDRSNPEFSPLDPQQAVDEAFTWALQTVVLLKESKPAEAMEPAKRALYIGDLPLAALVEDQTPMRDFVQALHEKGRKPKTIRNHVQVVKAVVASARDPKSRKQLFPVAWDNDYIDCPVVGEQRTPSVVAQQMSLIVERAEGQYRVMFALKGASGLRFGEILGLKIENVLDDCTRLCIIEKLWKSEQQDFLKTTNGKRFVEIHSSIAALLREHIGKRKSGYVFCTDTDEPLDQSNILSRVLHPILAGDENTPGIVVNINGKNFQGVKAGAHIFRRFRNSFLRSSNVPTGLLKYWMGHSRKQDMTDVYDKSSEDAAWRAQVAEQIGVGFTVPNCTDCTEKEKEATGAVASK